MVPFSFHDDIVSRGSKNAGQKKSWGGKNAGQKKREVKRRKRENHRGEGNNGGEITRGEK